MTDNKRDLQDLGIDLLGLVMWMVCGCVCIIALAAAIATSWWILGLP